MEAEENRLMNTLTNTHNHEKLVANNLKRTHAMSPVRGTQMLLKAQGEDLDTLSKLSSKKTGK